MDHSLFGLGAGPLLTGIVLMPRALGQAVAGPISGPIGHHIGTANFLAIGPLIQTAGAIALALWHGHIWALWLELAGLGVGFGVAISVADSNRCTHALTHDVIWAICSVAQL